MIKVWLVYAVGAHAFFANKKADRFVTARLGITTLTPPSPVYYYLGIVIDLCLCHGMSYSGLENCRPALLHTLNLRRPYTVATEKLSATASRPQPEPRNLANGGIERLASVVFLRSISGYVCCALLIPKKCFGLASCRQPHAHMPRDNGVCKSDEVNLVSSARTLSLIVSLTFRTRHMRHLLFCVMRCKGQHRLRQ